MTLKAFIFSTKTTHRTVRHISFWFAYSFYFFLQSISPASFEELYTAKPYFSAFVNTVCFAPFYFAVTYFFIYRVYPGTIKKEKYFSFVIAFLLSYAVGVLINYFTAAIFLQITHYQPDVHKNRLGLSYCNTRWGIIIAIIGVGIKLSKDWYCQQVENTRILKRKNRAELQLRKSRLHPKLLLRTLDNIHRSAANNFTTSGEMILKLSDILSYSLYDSEEEKVPVEKEMKAVKNLIKLEQLGSNIQGIVNISHRDKLKETYMVPMTFVKLLEDCITLLHRDGNSPVAIQVDVNVQGETIQLLVKLQSKKEILHEDKCKIVIETFKKRMQEHYTEREYHINCSHTPRETIVQLSVRFYEHKETGSKTTIAAYENA
jgi:hypothetical protein